MSRASPAPGRSGVPNQGTSSLARQLTPSAGQVMQDHRPGFEEPSRLVRWRGQWW
jgi:hypothetical protein